MTRGKLAQARRDEILDAAGRLFVAKGYAATTINDLLEEVGIARGTLYHHYRSKEQVLQGLIRRHGDRLLAVLDEVRACDQPALLKLGACLASLTPQDSDQAALVAELSTAGDAAMFMTSLDDLVVRLAPAIAEVVEQGVDEGVFDTAHPLTTVRVLLVAIHGLLDNPGLAWTVEERADLLAGIVTVAERTLGARPGSLAAMAT